ncbi:BTAD domain-containing putative transcriptional regulator [Streptomyces sp. NPDC057877]|uniref:AfsR/SARP family transcriptional regulator n=1 Tax=Streptomyces sp. NPDC057877 TaxID=3346269 RepID=UPI0036CE35B0
MDVELLGHVALRVGDDRRTPSAPKARQVLALLLVNANRLVSTDALIEELWAERPPRSALSALQTYVFQLRQLLGQLLPEACPKEILVTTPNGYEFRVAAENVDLRRYERHRMAGQRAFQAGDNLLAVEQFRAALHVFASPPLANVRRGMHLEAEIVRLEESRIGVQETRIEAELELGHHHEVLSELSGLASQRPQHEGFHRQLMLALYRCGRRPQALRVFQDLRQSLVTELGLEPSRELQLLQQAILSADPRLSAADRTPYPRRPRDPDPPPRLQWSAASPWKA